jgi:hypothetical protein
MVMRMRLIVFVMIMVVMRCHGLNPLALGSLR